MAEARALKFFFTKGDSIKSCQKDGKSPLIGAWFCSRDAFFVSISVKLKEKILHATQWAAINYVVHETTAD